MYNVLRFEYDSYEWRKQRMNKKIIGLLMIAVILVFMGCPNPEGDNEETGSTDYVSPNIGTLKYIPAGSFQRDDTPANISVIKQAYRMSLYEITRAQFYVIVGSDPSNLSQSSGISDPVQEVNWYHAIAFCNKLSITEGFTPVYSVIGVDFTTVSYAEIPITDNATWNAATADWNANGYRLPIEMEWQWAAMGAQDARTKAFAGSDGSNAIGDYAVFGYNYISETGRTTTARTNPVGSKLANELGLFDMSGNVWELCWDWYADDYPAGTIESDTDAGRGAASGTLRVERGSGWPHSAYWCAVDARDYTNPYNQGGGRGFRVVRP